MRCDVHTPGPPLAGLVANLWSLSDSPGHARERIVASGTQELVVNLCADEFVIYDAAGLGEARRFSGAMVSGAYSGSFAFDTRAHASVVGVHFEPGGALPFLGPPLGDLADRHVDLETLWGQAARDLRERLCAAPTARLRFRILEDALRARLARPFRRHAAVQLALARLRGPASVGEVTSEAGLSRRRLIEVFKDEVGMTPKLFARVQRFQRARKLAERCVSPDWSQLALACGYFDQAHLIRDCVAFAGDPPGALRLNRGPEVKENHIALVAPRGSKPSNSRARGSANL